MRAVVSLSERYLDERIGAFFSVRVVQSVSKDIHWKQRTRNNSVLTKKVKIFFFFLKASTKPNPPRKAGAYPDIAYRP